MDRVLRCVWDKFKEAIFKLLVFIFEKDSFFVEWIHVNIVAAEWANVKFCMTISIWLVLKLLKSNSDNAANFRYGENVLKIKHANQANNNNLNLLIYGKKVRCNCFLFCFLNFWDTNTLSGHSTFHFERITKTDSCIDRLSLYVYICLLINQCVYAVFLLYLSPSRSSCVSLCNLHAYRNHTLF